MHVSVTQTEEGGKKSCLGRKCNLLLSVGGGTRRVEAPEQLNQITWTIVRRGGARGCKAIGGSGPWQWETARPTSRPEFDDCYHIMPARVRASTLLIDGMPRDRPATIRRQSWTSCHPRPRGFFSDPQMALATDWLDQNITHIIGHRQPGK